MALSYTDWGCVLIVYWFFGKGAHSNDFPGLICYTLTWNYSYTKKLDKDTKIREYQQISLKNTIKNHL
jgi:hypothetical protein